MDNEGYPEQHELDAIKQWDAKDVFNLIEYIKERWTYDSIKLQWGKDELFKRPTLFMELHTIGWSGNESIVNALLENIHFKHFWYVKWIRGGHHFFEINPAAIGYKKVSDMAKEKGISRQHIHHDKESYEWIVVGEKIKMCREKK